MDGPQSLRQHLRENTGRLHDTLDSRLGSMALSGNFGDFLAIQYAARLPLERWLARHGGECPPAQTPLIARDLRSMGRETSICPRQEWAGTEEEAPGLLWLLAGSSLGNRAILSRRRKAGLMGGESFLKDTAMPRYWLALRPRIERPVDDEAARWALSGARRGFAHFLACVDQECEAAAA